MTNTPSWQAELVEQYWAIGDDLRQSQSDFLAAIQAAYDLGAKSALLAQIRAVEDAMGYGVGFTRTTEEGTTHVPLDEIVSLEKETPNE